MGKKEDKVKKKKEKKEREVSGAKEENKVKKKKEKKKKETESSGAEKEDKAKKKKKEEKEGEGSDKVKKKKEKEEKEGEVKKKKEKEEISGVTEPSAALIPDAAPPSRELGNMPPLDSDEREIQEANFEVSGLLAMEDNSRNGVALNFTEPPDAVEPTNKWRFYIFKKGEEQNIIHVHRKSGFLFGKDRRVVDVATDHPTCSKQHAVMHFRQRGEEVIPYIMDLESTNGSFVNGNQIEPARYLEIKHADVLKFASSSREYVLINADKPK